jgi:hypothetical protein
VIQVHPGGGLTGLGHQRSRGVGDRGVGQSQGQWLVGMVRADANSGRAQRSASTAVFSHNSGRAASRGVSQGSTRPQGGTQPRHG